MMVAKNPSSDNKLKVEELWAFIAEDPIHGEGVMAAGMPGPNGQLMMMPLIGADINRAKSYFAIAQQISEVSKMPFKVLKFSNFTDITKEFLNEVEEKKDGLQE